MKIFKIKMMSGVEIPIDGEVSLQSFLTEANSGKKLVLTKYGIVNVASIDSITIHKEKMAELAQLREYKMENPEREVLGESPFKELFGEEYKKLGN